MKPQTLLDLDKMVHADQLRLCPSFRADGSIVWSLVAYSNYNGALWGGLMVEMGRTHGWR